VNGKAVGERGTINCPSVMSGPLRQVLAENAAKVYNTKTYSG
jgi:hypothetical protein